MNFVSTNLSAGRVQSAAVKMIVDQDRLRAKFISTNYFDLKADLTKINDEENFNATLVKMDGLKVASSNDFDSKTGELKNENVLLLTESQSDLSLIHI